MHKAVHLNQPSSDLRLLFLELVRYGAESDRFFRRFVRRLSDIDDTEEDVHGKIGDPERCLEEPYRDVPLPEDNVNGQELLQRLNEGQRAVGEAIIGGVADAECQSMFLQGAARTGRTFPIAVLVAVLRGEGQRCLISETTGIAAVQYPGGCTLHSLFKLGIDDESRSGVVSRIGRGSGHGDSILRADVILINEVLILTSWVANRVPMTLQRIADNELEFGGRMIPFVGDLLQLPPVVPNFGMPVGQRLITRLPCWPIMRKFRLERSMRCLIDRWNAFIGHIAKGESDELPDSHGLRLSGVTVRHSLKSAFDFICRGLLPSD
jgi:hypothetical protein